MSSPVRVVLRPLASALPLDFLAPGGATPEPAAEQLGWSGAHEVAVARRRERRADTTEDDDRQGTIPCQEVVTTWSRR